MAQHRGDHPSRRAAPARVGTRATPRNRREGRRLALVSVFEAEFGQRTADAILERHLALEGERRRLPTWPVRSWPTFALSATLSMRGSASWRPNTQSCRLARMDRALLRCGLCEMLHSPATPARVAIAEWVELARIYSGEPMRRLMNGVLGRVARDKDATR